MSQVPVVPKEPGQTGRFARRRIFAKAARTGLEHFVRHGCPEGRPILLPAYIGRSPLEGSGVHDPIEAAGRPFAFYRVDENLRADLADLRTQLAQTNASAVLVIHYFGFEQSDTAEIRALAKARNVLLIEDCAHVSEPIHAAPSSRLGTYGDVVIYSIHKTLPTRDGGILEINNPKLSLPPLPPTLHCQFETLEVFANADWRAIGARRRENYAALAELVAGVRNVERMVPKLPENVVPMNFPIKIDSARVKERDRFSIYQRLRERGVEAVALYHTLIEQIEPARYPVSHDISQRILNLPIHQDVAPGDLGRIAEELDWAVNK